MIEELKKNRELTNATASFIGSALGYEIGRSINPEAPVVPMLLGGLIGRVVVEIMLGSDN